MNVSDDRINTHQLPPQLRRLVACIGLSDTIKLVKALGGTIISVPTNASANCTLLQFISTEALIQLVQHWGNEKIQLPKCDKILQQIRNQEIQAERYQLSNRQLALKHNLTRRHIINISKAIEDTRQVDLFD